MGTTPWTKHEMMWYFTGSVAIMNLCNFSMECFNHSSITFEWLSQFHAVLSPIPMPVTACQHTSSCKIQAFAVALVGTNLNACNCLSMPAAAKSNLGFSSCSSWHQSCLWLSVNASSCKIQLQLLFLAPIPMLATACQCQQLQNPTLGFSSCSSWHQSQCLWLPVNASSCKIQLRLLQLLLLHQSQCLMPAAAKSKLGFCSCSSWHQSQCLQLPVNASSCKIQL